MNAVTKSTLLRILSALVALPVYAFTIVTDRWYMTPILGCSLLVTLACLYEFYRITDRGEAGKAFMATGIAAAVLVNLMVFYSAFGHMYNWRTLFLPLDVRMLFFILTAALALALALQLFTRPIAGGTYSLGVTALGLVYIVFFFSHIILMRALTNGVYYILLLNIVVMINDSAAYFGGVLLGKHKTNFAVSPNKSWEGYATGLVGSVVATIVTVKIFAALNGPELFGVVESVILGVFLGMAGNLGDLVESAFKRDGSTKDSGSIIPGHGGMWDVFDALIFSFPLFYYYLILRGVR